MWGQTEHPNKKKRKKPHKTGILKLELKFQVFQSELKKIILVKSSLSQVRFNTHEKRLNRQCDWSFLDFFTIAALWPPCFGWGIINNKTSSRMGTTYFKTIATRCQPCEEGGLGSLYSEVTCLSVRVCVGEGEGGPCTVRSKASWLMVTWGHPMDRQTVITENITLPQLHWVAVSRSMSNDPLNLLYLNR